MTSFYVSSSETFVVIVAINFNFYRHNKYKCTGHVFCPDLQSKFNTRLEQESLEQKELRGLVESLERQVREKDAAQNDREHNLKVQEDKLKSERRKFETERDICLAKLDLEKSRIQVIMDGFQRTPLTA